MGTTQPIKGRVRKNLQNKGLGTASESNRVLGNKKLNLKEPKPSESDKKKVKGGKGLVGAGLKVKGGTDVVFR